MDIFNIISLFIFLAVSPRIYRIIQTHFSIKSSCKLHGTVVDYVIRSENKDTKTYALLIAYHDQDGIERHIESSFASNPPANDIGDTVIMLDYGDESPPNIFLFVNLFLIDWLFFCLGICFGGIAIGQSFIEWLYL